MTTVGNVPDIWEYEYDMADTDTDDLKTYRETLDRFRYEEQIGEGSDSPERPGYTLSELRDDHPDELVFSLVGREVARGHYDSRDNVLLVTDDRLEDEFDRLDEAIEQYEQRGTAAATHERFKDWLDGRTDWYERGSGQIDDPDDYSELFRQSHERQRKELLVNPVNGMFGMVAGTVLAAGGLVSGDPAVTLAGGTTATAGYTAAASQELLEEGRRDRFQEETAEMMLDRVEDELDDPELEIRSY